MVRARQLASVAQLVRTRQLASVAQLVRARQLASVAQLVRARQLIYVAQLVRARQLAFVAQLVRASQLTSVAQLVRALHRNRRAAGSIPARDLKLHFSQLFLVWSVINVYKFPLDNFHRQDPSTIIESNEMATKS